MSIWTKIDMKKRTTLFDAVFQICNSYFIEMKIALVFTFMKPNFTLVTTWSKTGSSDVYKALSLAINATRGDDDSTISFSLLSLSLAASNWLRLWRTVTEKVLANVGLISSELVDVGGGRLMGMIESLPVGGDNDTDDSMILSKIVKNCVKRIYTIIIRKIPKLLLWNWKFSSH